MMAPRFDINALLTGGLAPYHAPAGDCARSPVPMGPVCFALRPADDTPPACADGIWRRVPLAPLWPVTDDLEEAGS